MRGRARLFVLIALAQLVLPAWMIVHHERVLEKGEVFKFRTAPIDPRDPFRGEYVMLDFAAESGNWNAPDTNSEYMQKQAFASLAIDPEGYAMITDLEVDEPSNGAFLAVSYWSASDSSVDRVALPFDRFYLEEGDGAKTEQLLTPQWNEGEMSQPLPAYALVRVYHGDAVIEDLIVGDRSIHAWLNEPADQVQ